QRTIEPSDKAWDRLDAMLSVAEKKQTKRNWLWIAASLILFATIGSLFVRTSKKELIPTKNVVINENHHQENLPILTPELKDEKIVIINEEVIEREIDKKIISQNSLQVVEKREVFINDTNDDFQSENSRSEEHTSELQSRENLICH